MALAPGAWPWAVGAIIGNHLLLGIAGMMPRSRALGPNIRRLPASSAARGEVALTFDDGPDPEVTPRVLELLRRHRARASFFCIARKAMAHPELIHAIRAEGHCVENHSFAHSPLFACYGLPRLWREITAAQDALSRLSGEEPRFFRAPVGLRSPLLDPVLARLGLGYVSWSRRGYDGVSTDSGAILQRLTRNLRPGEILVLHDGRPAKTKGGEAVALTVLRDLLAELDRRGLRGVSLRSAFDAEAASVSAIREAGSFAPAAGALEAEQGTL